MAHVARQYDKQHDYLSITLSGLYTLAGFSLHHL